jgi:hypothetical protein
MSRQFSLEGKTYRFLRWLFFAFNLLAWLAVLFADFGPDHKWLRRSGLIAALLFSTANLVLLHFHWRDEPPAPLGDEEKGGAPQ